MLFVVHLEHNACKVNESIFLMQELTLTVGYRTLELFRLNKMLETNDLSHHEEAEYALVIRAEMDFRFVFHNLTLIDMNQLYQASYKSTFGLHPIYCQ